MTTSATSGTGPTDRPGGTGPTENSMRRALKRARDGVALDVAETAVLLQARGAALDDLTASAARVRDSRPRAGRPPRCHHVLEERLHPPHPAVPGQVPLLHLRDRARQAPPGLPRHVHVPRRGTGHRPQGRGPRLQGSPDHPRRQARGPLAGGQGVAGRARLRRHHRLRPRHLHPHPGGDGPAAPPQPGRALLDGLPAAEAGGAQHGHDAGDDGRAALVGARRAAPRLTGQGARRPAAGS